MSASRVVHRLAAGAQLLRLGGHQPQRPVHPVDLGWAGGVDVDDRRQDIDEVARGGVVEAHGAADQRRRRAAPAVARIS